MDVQDKKKTSSSAKEIHVCHRCGWPFPNPHPSSKYRRAHKKHCGKIEGYKLLDSDSNSLHVAVSDDEHLSDDEQRTPSPKIAKENVKEAGSSEGNVLRSYRSEDDVFADAATDFSDNGVSPGLGERMGSGGKLESHVKAALVTDLTKNKVFKDNETSGITETILYSEVIGNEASLSQSTEPASETANLGVADDSNGQHGPASNSVPVVDEDVVRSENDEHEKAEETTTSVEANLASQVNGGTDTQRFESQVANDAAQLEYKFNEITDQNSEPAAHQVLVPEIETEVSLPLTLSEPNLENDKSLTAAALGEIEKDEQIVSELDCKAITREVSTQTGSSTGLFPADVETDLAIGSTSRILDQLAEISDLTEEAKLDTLSVAETLPELEKPEVVAGEFKDYKVFKSSIPLDLGGADVILLKDDKNEAADPEEHRSVLTTENSTLNQVDDGDDIEKAVSSPVEGEVLGYNGSAISKETGGYAHESQTNNNHEEFQPYSTDEKPLKHEDLELMTGELADVVQAPSVGEETSQITKLIGGTNADTCGIAGNEKLEAGNEHSAKDTALSSYAAETEVDNSASSMAGDHIHALEKDMIVQDSATDEILELKTAGNLVNHADMSDDSVKGLSNSSESGTTNLTNVSARDIENVVDMSTSLKSSNEEKNVKDENLKDVVASVSLPDEGDGRMATQHPSVSPVDMSITSSSRADSMEGNWGSVSVLSTQSDVALAATLENSVHKAADSQSTEKLENNSLKSQDAAKEFDLDKADDFEPPSFATLVQSDIQDNKKPEIQTEQKVDTPKSEALQAGWFPSLTNVVNESEGRKKNEELIAKVTNWTAGKQHGPLKALLNEAHEEAFTKSPPNGPKQAPAQDQANDFSSNSNGGAATTVSSIMGSEMPNDRAAKKENQKEWDSPARYPTAIKKEKRKGKPYWVPFVCCSSMQHDI